MRSMFAWPHKTAGSTFPLLNSLIFHSYAFFGLPTSTTVTIF